MRLVIILIILNIFYLNSALNYNKSGYSDIFDSEISEKYENKEEAAMNCTREVEGLNYFECTGYECPIPITDRINQVKDYCVEEVIRDDGSTYYFCAFEIPEMNN
ncbi:uncharacterized protein LOC122511854 [Leptopilina heterotoma]|uniref:uncharacterized protein LOC122511854 n=1 Tax=Leptopilina heterotoma TaxID=63436 RepID=UPI001CA93B8E|nr:uncharacterized protein LOC122511854 [Leptopilina heterotoma]